MFSANIIPLQAAVENPVTMEFWSKQPRAWEELQKERQAPGRVMHQYFEWLQTLCTDPDATLVFVAYPAVFDFAYVHWYLIHFVGVDPFGFSGETQIMFLLFLITVISLDVFLNTHFFSSLLSFGFGVIAFS